MSIDVSDFCAKSQYQYLDEDDKMMIAHIQQKIMNRENKKYLDMHPYTIKQYSNGYWGTYLPDAHNNRKKILKTTEVEVNKIVIAFWKEQEDNPTIRELFEEWNNERMLDGMISRRSYDRYNQVFKRHFQEVEDHKIRDATIQSVLKFLRVEKRDKNLNKKSFGLLKSTIVGILETADDMEKLPFDYLKFQNELRKTVKKMKFTVTMRDDEDEVFNEEEYEKIVTYLMDNMDVKNTAILLMFITGMRVGEIVALAHDAVKDEYIKVCRSETRYENPDGEGYIYEVQDHPKTSSGFRYIVLPEQYSFLFGRLRLLNPFGEWLFTDADGKRYTTNSISRRLDTICKHLGIKPKSPHKARKTVGTIYFDANLDRKFITDQMGWSSEAVGETHYHRKRKSMEKKREMLSSIQDFQI